MHADASPALYTAVRLIAFSAFVASVAAPNALAQSASTRTSKAEVERGRYLVRISGCNDCHTPGYMEAAGKVDEKLWLTGSPLGWNGPWGTTYASNLRKVTSDLSETQWLKHARSEWRPPMPWFNMAAMSDRDLKAIYHYIRHLGPAGNAVPAYLPPDKQPQAPYVQFVPPKK